MVPNIVFASGPIQKQSKKSYTHVLAPRARRGPLPKREPILKCPPFLSARRPAIARTTTTNNNNKTLPGPLVRQVKAGVAPAGRQPVYIYYLATKSLSQNRRLRFCWFHVFSDLTPTDTIPAPLPRSRPRPPPSRPPQPATPPPSCPASFSDREPLVYRRLLLGCPAPLGPAGETAKKQKGKKNSNVKSTLS